MVVPGPICVRDSVVVGSDLCDSRGAGAGVHSGVSISSFFFPPNMIFPRNEVAGPSGPGGWPVNAGGGHDAGAECCPRLIGGSGGFLEGNRPEGTPIRVR